MRKINWNTLILTAFIVTASIYYFLGLAKVPFHPDESTQLFMSADFDIFFSHPSELIWDPKNENDVRQHYREMDAPLTRDLMGIARWVSGLEPLKRDWNWSLSWQENKALGALPDGT